MKQLITRNQVLDRTSLSVATLWRIERKGEFPKAVQITKNRVAYDAQAVDSWIKDALFSAPETADCSNAAVVCVNRAVEPSPG